MEKLFRQPCGQGAAPRLCRQGTENARLQHCLCQRAEPGTILHRLRHAIRRAPGPASLCVLCQFKIDRQPAARRTPLPNQIWQKAEGCSGSRLRSQQIGRASCRERVWQSVVFAVVAVSLKKIKREKKKTK